MSRPEPFRVLSSHYSAHGVPDTTTQIYTSRRDKRMLNQYRVGRVLGKGMHGKVRYGEDTLHDNAPVAIKLIKREQRGKLSAAAVLSRGRDEAMNSHETRVRHEIAIMKKMRHDHVVKLLEVIDDESNQTIFLIIEYMEGGEVIWRTPDNQPILTVDQSLRIFRDVVLGLEYLHHHGIIHRDIKPANLLWTADRLTVKIADFGVSHFSYTLRTLRAGSAMADIDAHDILSDDRELGRTVGSPAFLAPELCEGRTPTVRRPPSASGEGGQRSSDPDLSPTLRGKRAEKPPDTTTGPAVDVWALGVTLYCLLFGRATWDNQAQNVYQLFVVIPTQDFTIPETMGVEACPTGGRHWDPNSNSQGRMAVELLERLLTKDPQKRITLPEVKRNAWVVQGIEDPEDWARRTEPRDDDFIEITAKDADTAVRSKAHGNAFKRLATAFGKSFRPRSKTTSGDRPGESSSSLSRPRTAKASTSSSTAGASHKGEVEDLTATPRRPQSSRAETDGQVRVQPQSPSLKRHSPRHLRISSDRSPPFSPTTSARIPKVQRSVPLLSPGIASSSRFPMPGSSSSGQSSHETQRSEDSRSLWNILSKFGPYKPKKKAPGDPAHETDHEDLGHRASLGSLASEPIAPKRAASAGELEDYDTQDELGEDVLDSGGTDDGSFGSEDEEDEDVQEDIFGSPMHVVGAGGYGIAFPPGTAARSKFGAAITRSGPELSHSPRIQGLSQMAGSSSSAPGPIAHPTPLRPSVPTPHVPRQPSPPRIYQLPEEHPIAIGRAQRARGNASPLVQRPASTDVPRRTRTPTRHTQSEDENVAEDDDDDEEGLFFSPRPRLHRPM